jgi:hypothetical protein
MIWLNASEYATLHGVSRQRVMQWIEKGLPCFRPKARIILIEKCTPRPKIKKGGRPTNYSKENNLSMSIAYKN